MSIPLKLSWFDLPEELRQIDEPPQQVFCQGRPPAAWFDRPRLAVVGSRKASAYGLKVTDQLTQAVARHGVVVISGLAYGVDAAAHRAALAAGGLTVAVLGSSIDRIYPASHQSLARQILESGGCLLSEYGPGEPIQRSNFIARNRLISAFSEAVLITEASATSGSLHTARFGLEQGRTVMAVPGAIDSPSSQGCNNLIKSGALAVTEAGDVYLALGLRLRQVADDVIIRGSPAEELVYRLINQGLHQQTELAAAAKLDAAGLNRALTGLEIAGHIRPLGGGHWMII
ncbi:DNA-protecting protein DprA [Candidatus Saccharibacteria bacterium]|nr:DNA-protecting protein DprA [Candidatus Saccharibacteria bacterium]